MHALHDPPRTAQLLAQQRHVLLPHRTLHPFERHAAQVWHERQHALANGYFMGCLNRVGTEAPWGIGKFYGTSYFVDPRGQFLATGSEDRDELVVADMDLSLIEEVRRTWQFYRDRRPESYEALTELGR